MTANRNPYAVLDVEPAADDKTIRDAYLAKIRAHPPDRAPAEFQAVRTAFEAIRTEKARLTHALFAAPADDLEVLWCEMIDKATGSRPQVEQFQRLIDEAIGQIKLPPERLT